MAINPSTGLVPVKLINAWSPYATGDVAGFTPADAALIVDRGAGTYFDPADDHRGGVAKRTINRMLGTSPVAKGSNTTEL